jgi:hypothetical protein
VVSLAPAQGEEGNEHRWPECNLAPSGLIERIALIMAKKMRRYVQLSALALAVMLATTLATPALAHQPFFEEEDIKADAPWKIADPTISTAVYATLDSTTDVDYFAFEGQAGQAILLQIVIPQIEGQEEFAPHMALLGAGLPSAELPQRVERPDDAGALLLSPPPGPAPTFFEPFSQTSYWERQDSRETLPADGRYVAAAWHEGGHVGRYVFVVGDKEQLGGDLTFPIKMRSYWTPVTPGAPPPSFSLSGYLVPLVAVAAGAAVLVVLIVWIAIRRRRKAQ